MDNKNHRRLTKLCEVREFLLFFFFLLKYELRITELLNHSVVLYIFEHNKQKNVIYYKKK